MASDNPLEHAVTAEQAARMTKAFRASAKGRGVIGGHFSRPILDAMLAQPGCAGIRYYYAMNEKNEPALVLVGIDTKGNDLWKGTVAEIAYPCPPYCPGEASPLQAD